MDLVSYNTKWAHLFREEAKALRTVFGSLLLDIQHIGSTAIPRIRAKPIIDIAVLLPSFEAAQTFLQPLRASGYQFDQHSSSTERYFFRKGEPTQFHLSLTVPDVAYWNRQILFRDYLVEHPQVARKYEYLKEELLQRDPASGQRYTDGKSAFVQKVLTAAAKS